MPFTHEARYDNQSFSQTFTEGSYTNLTESQPIPTFANESSRPPSFAAVVYARPEWIAAIIIRKWITLIISAIGVLTNTLTVGLLCRSSIPKTSCTLMIIGLAVFDAMVSASNTLSNLNDNHLNWVLGSQVWCQLIYFFFSWSVAGSVWILVALTAERFVAVRFPLRAATICTRSHATMALVIITVATGLANLPYLITVIKAPNHAVCMFDSQYAAFLYIWHWVVDNSLTAYIPIVLVTLFNVGIVHSLARATREKMKISSGASQVKNASMNQQITRMCVAVSVMFVVCLLPVSVVSPIAHFKTASLDPVELAIIFLISNLTHCLLALNNTANFFLYVITGKRFRKEFKSIFCCASCKETLNSRGSMSRTVSTVL